MSKKTYCACLAFNGTVELHENGTFPGLYVVLAEDTSLKRLKDRVLINCDETRPSTPGGKDTHHFIASLRRPASPTHYRLSLAYWLRVFNDDKTLTKKDEKAEGARWSAGFDAVLAKKKLERTKV
jgi:hypothetical protein